LGGKNVGTPSWRAFFAFCVGAGLGVLGCKLVLLIYNSGFDFLSFLMILLLGSTALFVIAVILWSANLFPFQRHIEQLRKKNRHFYTSFVWPGVLLGTLIVLFFFNLFVFLWVLLYGTVWIIGAMRRIFSS
jgi:tellurite resistance protein TehA-like permease